MVINKNSTLIYNPKYKFIKRIIYFYYLIFQFLDNEDMTIKIQTLDNIFSLTIKKGSNIQEIKEKIAEVILLNKFYYKSF